MLNNTKFKRIAAVLTIAAMLVSCGCEKQQITTDSKPDLAGESNVLTLNCIVSYYQPDGSVYYTEQVHKIYPEIDVIVFTAAEPQGKYEWSVIAGEFSGPKTSKEDPISSEIMFDKAIAKALQALYLANSSSPVSETSVISGAVLNLDGQLYDKVNSGNDTVALFKNRRTNKIDTAKINTNRPYILRSYNFQKIANSNSILPTKIDVLAEKNLNERLLIAQFDCTITR